ncbi:type II secretion protein, partial [Vibrio splendidus]
MGEAIDILPNEDDAIRLKTNLNVWLIYNNENFHAHMRQQLKRCRNVHIESFSLLGMTEEYVKNIDAPDLIFVEASGGWAQKMVDLQSYNLQLEEHDLSLVVFGDESDNGSLKIALRLGASDFLSHDIPVIIE